jgi:hypothetical protein
LDVFALVALVVAHAPDEVVERLFKHLGCRLEAAILSSGVVEGAKSVNAASTRAVDIIRCGLELRYGPSVNYVDKRSRIRVSIYLASPKGGAREYTKDMLSGRCCCTVPEWM